ncbi:MAG: DUF2961 domain-containing protein [Chthonomonadales bacterium]|nr:DUF2961 domain-containing protein [Chthonomonadales bacterium]
MIPHADMLGLLAAAPQGRSRRVSSNEQPNWNDGNFDQTWLDPGAVLEMPVLQGPGIVRHMWFTSHAGGVHELNALTLRIYWDGRTEAGVEAPLGDFFAVGHGTPAAVESVPVQVSPTGSLTCYWPMPFHRSARIVVTNDNPERGAGLYWQVDWTQLPSLPTDAPLFHARYRQEYPAVGGRDYRIADIEGRGRYVGTVMAVTLAQDGWFGEGDDFFYIDGEDVPSLQGTGTEDYFNDAWGFRERTGLWFGQPRWQGWSAGDSGVCYRWHLPDPVDFERSLRLELEHKGNRAAPEEAWYVERPDFLSSVAFWYQTGEPKPFGGVPSWPERRVPWRAQHLVRALRSARTLDAPPPVVRTLGFFGGRPVLVWHAPSPHALLELPFEVAESGRHAVRLTAWACPEGGDLRVDIDDGGSPAVLSCRASEEGEIDLLLGTHRLKAGPHVLTVRAETPGQAMLEDLRLLALPPEADRAVRTHNEAHFVRLGIGRAVYAYRLAYDALPESLGVLVEEGIMDARYASDENMLPLRSRLEDGRFVVECTAPGGWTWSWRGLDARR